MISKQRPVTATDKEEIANRQNKTGNDRQLARYNAGNRNNKQWTSPSNDLHCFIQKYLNTIMNQLEFSRSDSTERFGI